MEKQVDKSHYAPAYAHRQRWASYWWQINSALREPPLSGKVLVVGVGDGVVPDYLKKAGKTVTTLDIDPELRPDTVGDIRRLPFADQSFATAICAEVLEHLPWSDFTVALRELGRVTSGRIILSLPDARGTLLEFRLKLPWLPVWQWFHQVGRAATRPMSAQHHWEIGRPGFNLAKVRSAIQATDFQIMEDFVSTDCPTIHFFILEKRVNQP